ncbi:hypothetical protein DSO57_1014112 [Entomophthora muscae]|uniref:Uncharacterized protein n=1 Tax=Entomophthora muscae TaxID=34485 RepID=A0ACC2UR25_9FUNG|nr:hypothetical protein DSO57_1014112 [Entomophthora muscae]
MYRGCYSATGDVIKTLSLHCPNLEEINLSGCRRISSLQLEQLIDTSPHLKAVDLSGLFSVTAASIEALARGCRKVEKVNLAWCKHTSNEIDLQAGYTMYQSSGS